MIPQAVDEDGQHHSRLHQHGDINLAGATHATERGGSIHGGQRHKETPQGKDIDKDKSIADAHLPCQKPRHHRGRQKAGHKVRHRRQNENHAGMGRQDRRLLPPFPQIKILLQHAGTLPFLQERLYLVDNAGNQRRKSQQHQGLYYIKPQTFQNVAHYNTPQISTQIMAIMV